MEPSIFKHLKKKAFEWQCGVSLQTSAKGLAEDDEAPEPAVVITNETPGRSSQEAALASQQAAPEKEKGESNPEVSMQSPGQGGTKSGSHWKNPSQTLMSQRKFSSKAFWPARQHVLKLKPEYSGHVPDHVSDYPKFIAKLLLSKASHSHIKPFATVFKKIEALDSTIVPGVVRGLFQCVDVDLCDTKTFDLSCLTPTQKRYYFEESPFYKKLLQERHSAQ
eukprot:1132218-Karenia_brevis.AAC.1